MLRIGDTDSTVCPNAGLCFHGSLVRPHRCLLGTSDVYASAPGIVIWQHIFLRQLRAKCHDLPLAIRDVLA